MSSNSQEVSSEGAVEFTQDKSLIGCFNDIKTIENYDSGKYSSIANRVASLINA